MLLAAMLGVLLCFYLAVGLLTPPVPPPGRAEPWLSPVIGVTGGLIAGMTGSYAVPGVRYLQALGLPRDALVQALGITVLVFTAALGTSLAHHGLMPSQIATLSLAATVPALVAMALGRPAPQDVRGDVPARVLHRAARPRVVAGGAPAAGMSAGQ